MKQSPKKIPATDLYADVPLYGRYYPKPDDFRVDLQHVNSQTPDSLKYWASIITLCTEENQIYPADTGGRDVFALGNMIVKSSHLHALEDDQPPEIDFSYADQNGCQAIALAKTVLHDVKVPIIYFAGKVSYITVYSSNSIAYFYPDRWSPSTVLPYKQSFKQQGKEILHQLHTIKPTEKLLVRCHIVPDPNILSNGRLNPIEGDILFSTANDDPDRSFMHNDFTQSNCLVDNDKIVGLVDWEMAGFLGWKTAGEVHRRIGTPQREHFTNVNLSEKRIQDMMFWNDLYDEEYLDNHTAI
ncbi:hypothetical protein N7488_006236 [Penicillium malachiteum]|nr:hypothetical protein N7488_006236 [Penicillium malachiteum]